MGERKYKVKSKEFYRMIYNSSIGRCPLKMKIISKQKYVDK